MPRLPHNRYNKNFSQKIGFITFIKLLNPNFMQKIRKKRFNPEKTVLQIDGRTELNS